MYVEALLKVRGHAVIGGHEFTHAQVLRRYSDKTIAMDYVRELESYTAGASDLVMSGEPHVSACVYISHALRR